MAAVASVALTGCLEEYTPTDVATKEQIAGADKSGLSNGVSSYMLTFSDDTSYDIGFPGFGIWRDAMTADFPIVDSSWDYFIWFNTQTYLGDWQLQSTFWQRYYGLVQKANNILSVCSPETNAADAPYAGNALVYRAMAYLDMQRMYEWRTTGVSDLDQAAQSRGIMGLTVPIVTENTTEAEARNNPRVPYWHMYRFILNDLNRAAGYLASTHAVDTKTNASLGTCYGQLARTWLEIGTRFDLHADHLGEALQHEDDTELADLVKLDIRSAADAYANAARYARLAIAEGYAPLTESQWYDTTSGFNTPNQAWMWCVTIAPTDQAATYCTWQSFVSFTSPEPTYGLCASIYSGGRMIDARLFQTINSGDWRRDTWIAPGSEGSQEAYNSRYARTTTLPYSEWSEYRSLVGFKFHPAQGDRNTSTIGNAVSIPLMRVEEMYLIEAEAVGRSQGVGAGKQLLETFLNNYRYNGTGYVSTAASLDDFLTEVFNNKRVEFWGEGIVLWDYCRMERPIQRGYIGTNHPSEYWFNSFGGRKAPWANFYIPNSELNRNRAMILNPDPSNAIRQWAQ